MRVPALGAAGLVRAPPAQPPFAAHESPSYEPTHLSARGSPAARARGCRLPAGGAPRSLPWSPAEVHRPSEIRHRPASPPSSRWDMFIRASIPRLKLFVQFRVSIYPCFSSSLELPSYVASYLQIACLHLRKIWRPSPWCLKHSIQYKSNRAILPLYMMWNIASSLYFMFLLQLERSMAIFGKACSNESLSWNYCCMPIIF